MSEGPPNHIAINRDDYHAKVFNRETIAKGLVNLGRVIDALPDSQRRELLRLMVNRVVVKSWSDETPGIQGNSIVIAPDLGTRRYSVKINLSESSLLSESFTASVDLSPSLKMAARVGVEPMTK